jgi:pimeloyl-ACP methyl ester carboxylesterase
MDALFGSSFDGYRLVLLDQRGTGTAALRCPALQRQMGSTDLTVPTRAAVTACAQAIGPRRRFFSTADTVEDVEALRVALGAERLALDGVSYGTFVAERYALAHPGRVSRLVLDSVVPHAGAEALEATNAHAVARVLRAVCRSGCAGDPAKDLAAVVAKRRNGPALLNALVTLSVVDPRYTGVAAALHAARQGNRRPLDDLLGRLRPDAGTRAEALSQGLHASTLCADTPMPWGGPATATGQGLVRTCLWWPPTPAPRPRLARDLPPVPVLLLAGDRDLSTPLEWARREAARAPKGRLVVVPGAGHSVQTRTAAGRVAATAFLHGRSR